ncbi:MAG: hypothetical protein HZA31_12445 [Opitutae bacterium]|nr:hypothetical protein [Opitutae bacterium]
MVALGVFGLAILAMIGLFLPAAKSVTANAEAEAASRVAEALLTRLRALPLDTVGSYLKTEAQLQTENARPDYNPATDDKVFFASLAGDKIGRRSETAIWTNGNVDKFFEIALVRNATLSPEPASSGTGSSASASVDPSALWLAFTIRVRWPMFQPTAAGGAVQVGALPTARVPFDHSQKQVLFFAGSVRR